MKWSHRPSSLLTSMAAFATTTTATTTTTSSVTHSSTVVSSSRRHRTPCCFTSKAADNSNSNESETRPRLTSPYFTYSLETPSVSTSTTSGSHDTLYVPLTSFCNTRTLPQLRGPNFRLPPHVVAALCRVRDEETFSTSTTTSSDTSTSTSTSTGTKKYSFWCQWLDTQESYQMLPPPLPESYRYASVIPTDNDRTTLPSATLPPLSNLPQHQINDENDHESNIHHRPTASELISEVQQWYRSCKGEMQKSSETKGRKRTIVIMGEGEPTVRFYDLLQFIQQLHQCIAAERSNIINDNVVDGDDMTTSSTIPNVQLRIMTNGLLSTEQAQELLQCCLSTSALYSSTAPLSIIISVLFITSDPKQYNEIMDPIISPAILHSFMDANEPQITTVPVSVAHDLVQEFIRTVGRAVTTAQQQQQQTKDGFLSLEVTAIDRPDIDKEALSKLVGSLGVTTPIRWRSYFP